MTTITSMTLTLEVARRISLPHRQRIPSAGAGSVASTKKQEIRGEQERSAVPDCTVFDSSVLGLLHEKPSPAHCVRRTYPTTPAYVYA
jgi:hypothetical protein